MNLYMKRLTWMAGIACLVLCLPGCATLTESQKRDARDRADLDRLKSEVERLEERIKGTAAAQEEQYSRIEALDRARNRSDAKIERRLEAAEKQIVAGDRARQADKKEIIDVLSRKFADLMQRQSRRSAPTGRGYEHVVKPGETLSEIADAYDVTVEVIVQGNDLRNPNAIRVGQKLFIPE